MASSTVLQAVTGEPARDTPVPVSIKDVRVLVAEDDPGTREALVEMLTMGGAVPCAVETAEEAFRAFEEFKPSALLCDIALPDEDGYALIRRIRSLPPGRGGNVPALALTALASEDDRRRAFAAGFQMHLAKPVDIESLLRDLGKLLGEASSASSPDASRSL